MRHWQKHMSVTKPMLQREKREKEGKKREKTLMFGAIRISLCTLSFYLKSNF